MQPYFFPYIGYYQLLNAVDLFVIYDNIQFTKKGWIHRNRILANGNENLISLSLKKGSDFLDVRERYLSSHKENNLKLLRKITASYQRAPYFFSAFPVIEKCLTYDNDNLFSFVHHSIVTTASYLNIQTPIIISSGLQVDHSLKGKDRVISMCGHLGATTYLNPPGGKDLYDASEFSRNGITLKFLQPIQVTYQQTGNAFVPWLSIIDLFMFNSVDQINLMLDSYELY